MQLRSVTSRPTIGLLLDWLEGEYQNGIFAGAEEAARESDVNLICFTGGVLNAPRWFWAERNSAFELVGSENVDGLIVTSTIANAVGTAKLVEYCGRFGSLPMCSIAVSMPGVPAIFVDHGSGLRQGLRHLIEDHGRRRVAFIRGPEGSDEAQRRLAVFRETLASLGVAVVPELIAPGDFLRATGATAVRRWIDQGIPFDAVVAANDEMALAALEVLRSVGTRVPEDVSVLGFDDSEESRFCVPPLATVRQPVRELGRQAVLLVLQQIRSGARCDSVQLGSELIPRQSCGCLRRVPQHEPPHYDGPNGLEGLGTDERCELASVIASASSSDDSGADRGWAGVLLDAFLNDLSRSEPGRFLAAVNEQCVLRAYAGERILSLQDALSALRALLRPRLPADEHVREGFERLLHEARVVVAERAQAAEGLKRVRLQRWARTFAEVSKAFLVTLDLSSLMNAIIDQLPRLQIPSCYLALYEDREAPATWARMLLACDALTPRQRWPWSQAAAARRTGDEAARFSSRELIPADLLPARRVTLVLEPLFYRDEQQGFVLFEAGPMDGAVYEGLRDQISGALKGAMHYERVAGERDRRHAMEKAAMDVEKERLIASGIQTLLMPGDRRSGALEMATAIVPAARSGGGGCDIIETARGCHMWLAQTGGEGLSGALDALLIQAAVLGSISRAPVASPADVLHDVCHVFGRRSQNAREQPVMTVVSVEENRVRLAGDPAWAVVCRCDRGTCEVWPEHGAEDGGRILEPGDVLLLFSRGIVEAHDARREPFGRERLARCLSSLRHDSAFAIRDGLLALLKRWTAVQREDLILSVVRRS